jgi:hypothetical protein
MSDLETFRTLIEQKKKYSDEQIDELRGLTLQLAAHGSDWRDKAQFRAAIETIGAIRDFDKASAQLITTTNALTERIRRLTCLGVAVAIAGTLLAGGSLVIALIALNRTGNSCLGCF